MPRVERMDGLLIEPEAILQDEAFLAMDDEARLAYLILLLNLWRAKRPGITPSAPRVLASLAWRTEEQWSRIEQQVAAALDTSSSPGHWVSQLMVSAHKRQQEWLESLRKAGRRGGMASRRKLLEPRSSLDLGLDEAIGMGKGMGNTLSSSVHDSNAVASPNGAATHVVATLPLVGKGTKQRLITQAEADHWSQLFPAVDVVQQLRSMQAWLESHKLRRKTEQGVDGFITTWLAKEQDKAHPASGAATHHRAAADRRATDENSGKFGGKVFGRVPKGRN